MSSDDPRPAGDDRRLSALAALATVLVIPVIVVAGHFTLWMAPATVIAAYAALPGATPRTASPCSVSWR